jgi:hypothetical protein
MSVRIQIATLLLAAGLFGQCPVLLSVNPSSIPAGSPNTTVNFTGNFMQLGDQALFLPPGSQTPKPITEFDGDHYSNADHCRGDAA